MRGLVLVVLGSGCSLLFDGSDLHSSHARSPDMSMTATTMMDMHGAASRDLAGAPLVDMRHGLAFASFALYSTGAGGADLPLGHFNGAARNLDTTRVRHGANLA